MAIGAALFAANPRMGQAGGLSIAGQIGHRGKVLVLRLCGQPFLCHQPPSTWHPTNAPAAAPTGTPTQRPLSLDKAAPTPAPNSPPITLP